MKFIVKSFIIAFTLMFASLGAGQALAKEQLLGTLAVQPKLQRDVLRVGAREGQYKSIRMVVRQGTIEVYDLQVVYGSGAPDNIAVRQTFKPGSSSRVIDLKGKTRAIKHINVIYKSKVPAKVQFYGVEAAATAAKPQWERLGCKSVGFIADRDVITVGRKEGQFKSIKLTVRQAPIEFFNVRVVFGNGNHQDFRIRQRVPAGSESRPIDLSGELRGLQRIEMLYGSIPTFKGKAEVCVQGLKR
jgi:hypothetical protein